MRAVEMAVYTILALVVGTMFLFFRTPALPEEDLQNKIEKEKFPEFALTFWESCGLGMKDANATIFVQGTGTLTKESLIGNITRMNSCDKLQSKSLGCGKEEHLIFTTPISLPHVLKMRCHNLHLEILS